MPNLFFNQDERFKKKVSNFPETLYRINDPTSKIHRLLYSILEIGIGQAKGMQDIAMNSQSSLSATTGSELDQYFQMFGIRRTPELSGGIKNSETHDAKFRIAISKFLQAISLGGTVEGIRLMAEASTGFPCHVVEPWRNPENSDGIARLLENSQPIGNEVVVIVYFNKPQIFNNENIPLVSDEENSIRARVIENCKIIAPLHTSITVKIENTIEDTEIVPAYVASGAFSFIEQSSEPELLSQEAEISFNNSIININTFEIEDEYTIPVGYVFESVDSLANTIKIQEQTAPLTLNFYLKLSNQENEEIILVKNRIFLQDPNVFTYEIERAQNQTEAIDLDESFIAFSNLVSIYSDVKESEIVFDTWQSIPLADSPDNFPSGKFPHDPTKYDINGEYLFEWSGQAGFEFWFKNYIKSMGGEVKDKKYRLKVNENTPTDSTLKFNIINKIMGPSYKFVRAIPKPRD